ncbi:hypothetical protein DJ72_01250 [Halorubrum distributum]|nr:hypothetical protein DJ72_01250 [Halorubrum distributum]
MVNLQIDHVTVAGRNLSRLREAFDRAGLDQEYGGRHSNGVTHMSVVGFRDGSYLELISTVDPDGESPWWNAPIRGDGGPCAWAIEVEDIEAVSTDLADRGIAVEGPNPYERVREDGTTVEWDLTTLGEGELGSTLPFLISDRTPRERRVQPTGGLAESPIHGIDTVILGVPDIKAAMEKFETAFDMRDPQRGNDRTLSATVASYPDQPVALAEPREEGWLTDRIDKFGPRPIAYLLGSDEGIPPTFDDVAESSFMDRSVGWLPVTEPVGRRYVGVVAKNE